MNLDELDDDLRVPTDFRRAGGAPLVRSLDGKRWERYSRPSSWGGDLDSKEALNIWKLDRAIEGVAVTPSLAAKIAANLGRKEGRKELREQAIQIGRGEEAADLGTALHAMAHRLETEESFRAPPPYDADLAAYLMRKDEAGLESTHFECQVCSDVWRAAGTADRIYRTTRELILPDGSVIPPGTSLIGDLKTGKKLEYALPGFCIQLALYVDGCFYDVATDVRSPLPDNLHTRWGVVVWLPAGQATCTLLWVDLEIGRVGARLVQGVREWRKREDFSSPFTFPTSDEVAVLSSGVYELEHPVESRPMFGSWVADVEEMGVEQAEYDSENPEAVENPVDFEGQWLAAMLPWAQDRINRIGLLSAPKALLIQRWPENVPPLRTGNVTPLQLAEVLDLLDAVESAFSLPFPEGDPRLAWNQGVRSADMLRGNQPIRPVS